MFDGYQCWEYIHQIQDSLRSSGRSNTKQQLSFEKWLEFWEIVFPKPGSGFNLHILSQNSRIMIYDQGYPYNQSKICYESNNINFNNLKILER